MIGPDPLKICDINPLDYRTINGVWVYDPGWWKNIEVESATIREAEKKPKKKARK